MSKSKPSEITPEEFREYCVRNGPEKVLGRLKLILKEGGNTDCQNLDYMEVARDSFDKKNQARGEGTKWELKFRDLQQNWLRGGI